MSEKIVIIQAGLKGGSGKTTQLAMLHFWYEFHMGITPRCFDLDPGGSFHSMVGAQSPHITMEGQELADAKYTMESVVTSILKDTNHSVFLIDLPSSSVDRAKSTFSGIDWEDLVFEGVQVVLLGNLTANPESAQLWKTWKELFAIGESGVRDLPILNEISGKLPRNLVDSLGDDAIFYPVIEHSDIVNVITKNKYNPAHVFVPFMTNMRKYATVKTSTQNDARELKTYYTEERIKLFPGITDFNFISARNIAKTFENFFEALRTSYCTRCLIPAGHYSHNIPAYDKSFDSFLPWVSGLQQVTTNGEEVTVFISEYVEEVLPSYASSLSEETFSPVTNNLPTFTNASDDSDTEEIVAFERLAYA